MIHHPPHRIPSAQTPLSPERFLQTHTKTFAHLHDGVDPSLLEQENAVLEEERRLGRVKRASMQVLADDIHGLDQRYSHDNGYGRGGIRGRRPLSLVAKIQSRRSSPGSSMSLDNSPTFPHFATPTSSFNPRRISSDSYSTSSPLPTTPYFDYNNMLEPVLEPPVEITLYDPPSCAGTGAESLRGSIANSDLTWDEGFSGDGDDLGLAARYVISEEGGTVSGSKEVLENEERVEMEVLEERRRRILAIAQSTRLLEGKATRIPDDPSNWGSSDPAAVYLESLRLPTQEEQHHLPTQYNPSLDVTIENHRESYASSSSMSSSTSMGATSGIDKMRTWWTSEKSKQFSNHDPRQDFREGETGTVVVINKGQGGESTMKDKVLSLDPPIQLLGGEGSGETSTTNGWKSRRLTGFLSPFQLPTITTAPISHDTQSPNSNHTTTPVTHMATTTTQTQTLHTLQTLSPSSKRSQKMIIPTTSPLTETETERKRSTLSLTKDKARISVHHSSHSLETLLYPSTWALNRKRKLPKSKSNPSVTAGISAPILPPPTIPLPPLPSAPSQVSRMEDMTLEAKVEVENLPTQVSKPVSTSTSTSKSTPLSTTVPVLPEIQSKRPAPSLPPSRQQKRKATSDHYSYRSSFPLDTISAFNSKSKQFRSSEPTYLRSLATMEVKMLDSSEKETSVVDHPGPIQPVAPLMINTTDIDPLPNDTIPPFTPVSPSIRMSPHLHNHVHHHILSSESYVPHRPKISQKNPQKWLFIFGFVFPLLWLVGGWIIPSHSDVSTRSLQPHSHEAHGTDIEKCVEEARGGRKIGRWQRWVADDDVWVERCKVGGIVVGGTAVVSMVVLAIVLPIAFLA